MEVCAAGRWVQFQWVGLQWLVCGLTSCSAPSLRRTSGSDPLYTILFFPPSPSLFSLACTLTHFARPPPTHTLTQMMMYLTTNFPLKIWLGNVQHLTSCVRLWSPTNSDLPSPHPGETTRYTTKSPFLGKSQRCSSSFACFS